MIYDTALPIIRKYYETSVISMVERGRSVIRNLRVKIQKPPYLQILERGVPKFKKFCFYDHTPDTKQKRGKLILKMQSFVHYK